jgi:hypothetical protein
VARPQSVSAQFSIARQRTKEETQRVLAETAKRLNAEVLATDPRPTSYKRFVDGREGAPEEAVKATGVILYIYQRLDMVAQFALETLKERSPVLTGAYRDAHTMFIRGQAVTDLKSWQSGDEIVIANPLPYARKIELGKMKMRVPGTDHVYQQAEQIVNRKFGNLARVKFTYQGIVGFQKMAGVSARAIGGKAGNKSAHRYPALVISER